MIVKPSEAIIIERSVGNDIFETMSSGLARDYYTSVIEFICNGHDAGAHNFSVTASLDQLVMEDDGRGMDIDSIHNFFTKGTDYKRINPETPEGRKVLGRFGLATLLLRHLGDAYRLETWRNGQRIIVEQDFVRDGWRIPKTTVSAASEQNPSGTRITITKPRYKFNTEEFNLDRLKSEITWGFPPLPDFSISLNGQEVQKRATVRYGTEYVAAAQISDDVRISGSIIYNTHKGKDPKRLPLSGILLYVNGRRVGDPRDFSFTGVERRLQGNVLGIIEVYGLSDKIRFDRSGFLRSQAFLKIREYILSVLRSVSTDLDHGLGRRTYYAAGRQVMYIDQALAAATDRLNTKLKLEAENQYTLVFDDGQRSGPIARLDDEFKVIYINQSNPQLVRRTGKRRTGSELENTLLMCAIVALAEYEAGNKFNSAPFSELNEQIVKVSAKLFANYPTVHADLRTVKRTGAITPVVQLYISPYRLYEPPDIAQMTGWDMSTLKVLALSCLTPNELTPGVTNTRKIRGDKVRELLPQLEGFVPAGKLADPDYWSRDWRYAYDFRVDRKLAEHVGEVDFLKNIGAITPFILVKKGYEGKFASYWKKLK